MTEGDEKYKLGELTADMAAVKLSNLSAVTVERWEKRNAYVDKTNSDTKNNE